MIYTAKEGNDLIFKGLQDSEPFLAVKFGSVELTSLISYMHSGTWSDNMRHEMKNNAGFFPTGDQDLEKFCILIIKYLSSVNLMATWLNESLVIGSLPIISSQLRCIEPYYHTNPWSSALKGKKVLVIHPFEESIKGQYKKRPLLFNDPKVLPEFQLDTLKAVQSIAGTVTKYRTWMEALNDMCDNITKKDFDVAIIGAGAYGLPLAGFVKSIGKKAIHMGGATQILFGIRGKRWDVHEDISKLYNEHWVRPSLEETPPSYMSVEGGTYW